MTLAQAIRHTILAKLPPDALAGLEQGARYSFAKAGAVLNTDDYAVFPCDGMIAVRDAVTGVEAGSVGRTGGLTQPLGEPFEARAAIAMDLVVVHRSCFEAAMQRHPEVAALARRCEEKLCHDARVTASCNARHGISQRLARWLIAFDREVGNPAFLPVTQEDAALALGVRRTTVTLEMQGFAAEGLVSYRRGKVIIRNRPAFARCACDCGQSLAARALRGGAEREAA